jgi:hypothetical protein
MDTTNISQKINDVVIKTLVMKLVCILENFKSHKVIRSLVVVKCFIVVNLCNVIEKVILTASKCSIDTLIYLDRVLSNGCTYILEAIWVK